MKLFTGQIARIFAMAQGPWGSSHNDDGAQNGNDSGNGGGDGDKAPTPKGPRNPWEPSGQPQKPKSVSNIEDYFKKGAKRGSGGGGGGGGFSGLPTRPNGKSWAPLIIILVVAAWLLLSSVHRVDRDERGIVSMLGSYSRTATPGLAFTLPWPVETMSIIPVDDIRTEKIPGNNKENLILTRDQNLIDLGYSVRWFVKDPVLYQYQLKHPKETVREAAEAAMRAAIAEVTLDDALTTGRTTIEDSVMANLQKLLASYNSGIEVQGVEISNANPPKQVDEAFKEVSAAKQQAQTAKNEAMAYAQQLIAQAEGEAGAFDRVYAEYKLAPTVTKRRMYYETMERILSRIDKTIVESRGVTPYLALPEIKKRSEKAEPTETVTGKAATDKPAKGAK